MGQSEVGEAKWNEKTCKDGGKRKREERMVKRMGWLNSVFACVLACLHVCVCVCVQVRMRPPQAYKSARASMTGRGARHARMGRGEEDERC